MASVDRWGLEGEKKHHLTYLLKPKSDEKRLRFQVPLDHLKMFKINIDGDFFEPSVIELIINTHTSFVYSGNGIDHRNVFDISHYLHSSSVENIGVIVSIPEFTTREEFDCTYETFSDRIQEVDSFGNLLVSASQFSRASENGV